MSQLSDARARARSEVVSEVIASARRQLSEVGPAELSLRAVARDLGVVSSAVYRYVSSRDELLTLLIVAAYDSMGERVEEVVASSRDQPGLHRWIEAAVTIRSWAIEHPHEHALLYGTPVPGYEAPGERTTPPGTRASLALLSIVRDAHEDGTLVDRPAPEVSDRLVEDLAALRSTVDLDVADGVLISTLAGWTQMFGLVSFELFSQTRGVVEAHEDLLRACAELMGTQIGLARD